MQLHNISIEETVFTMGQFHPSHWYEIKISEGFGLLERAFYTFTLCKLIQNT